MDSYSSFSFDKEKFKPIVHAPMKKIIVIYKITDNLLLWNAHGLSFFFLQDSYSFFYKNSTLGQYSLQSCGVE